MAVKKIIGSILFAASFVGCAAFDQTMLVPEPNGVYRAIALDQSDFTAQQSALNRASKTCSDRQMRSVVTDQITYYRGMRTGAGPMSPTADNGDSMVHQTIPDKKNAEDYKTVITFHCE